MKVSFDFDGVLSTKESVRNYAKELINHGIEVWICTARYEDGSKNAFWGNTSNDDLYDTALKCGIPFSNIIFTNMEDKSSYLEKLKPLWHLDDDGYILRDIHENSSIRPIDVYSTTWKEQCEELLNI